MSVSDTIPANFDSSVAVWTLVDANTAKVTLSGIINVYTLGGVWTQIRASQDSWLGQGDVKAKTVHFDATAVSSLDGAGIAFLISVQEAQSVAGGKFEVVGLDARYQPLLKEFDPINTFYFLYPQESPAEVSLSARGWRRRI